LKPSTKCKTTFQHGQRLINIKGLVITPSSSPLLGLCGDSFRTPQNTSTTVTLNSINHGVPKVDTMGTWSLRGFLSGPCRTLDAFVGVQRSHQQIHWSRVTSTGPHHPRYILSVNILYILNLLFPSCVNVFVAIS
jgi:hypothetical protein